MKYTKIEKLVVVGSTITILLYMSLAGLVVWAIIHFIMKYW